MSHYTKVGALNSSADLTGFLVCLVVTMLFVAVFGGIGVHRFTFQANLIMGSANRQALSYEDGSYCKSVDGGVTVKVINPKRRNTPNETVAEQWISSEKLSVVSGAEQARLISRESGLFELQLPAGASCWGVE